jgi:hypothetical protein
MHEFMNMHGDIYCRRNIRLRVLENSVLWKTFEPKRDEVTGGW